MLRRCTLSRSLVVAVALLAGASVTACGSSSDDDTGTAATVAAAATVSTAATTKGAASDDPFCQRVQEASDQFGLSGGAGVGIDQALSQLPEAAKLLEQAAAEAPDEIKADIGILSTTLTDIAPTLSKMATLSAEAKTDPSKAAEVQAASAEFTQKLAAIQDPTFTAAIERLNAYTTEHCGISFS